MKIKDRYGEETEVSEIDLPFVVDFLGRVIHSGDRIAYPTRRGSSLYMNKGEVKKITFIMRKVWKFREKTIQPCPRVWVLGDGNISLGEIDHSRCIVINHLEPTLLDVVEDMDKVLNAN